MKLHEVEQKVQKRINNKIQPKFSFLFAQLNAGKRAYFGAQTTEIACSEIFLFKYYLSLVQQCELSETEQGTKDRLIHTITSTLDSLQAFSSDSASAQFHLGRAVEGNDMDLLEASLAAGANVDEGYSPSLGTMSSYKFVGSSKHYPLVAAASRGYHRVLARLLEASPKNVNVEEAFGTTLVILCRSQSKDALELIDKLLNLGADVNAATTGKDKGKTPLLEAILQKNEPVIEHLLQVPGILIDAPIHYSHYSSAFEAAVEKGLGNIVEKFLRSGTKFKLSFTMACKRGFVNVAKMLYDAKDKEEINLDLALLEVCEADQQASVEYLISLGANCNASCEYDKNKTPLTQAICNGNTKVAQFLVNQGANVKDAIQGLQANPLIFSAAVGDIDEVRKLLTEESCAINAVDKEGYTALLRASQAGNHQIVALLLENGADPNIRSTLHQRTALTEASKRGHSEVVRSLLKSPMVNTSLVDQDLGCNAKTIAIRHKNREITDLIKEFNKKQKKIPLIKKQLLELCHHIIELQGKKKSYNQKHPINKYSLLRVLYRKIKDKEFTSLEQLENAAKNVIMLSLQRVSFGLSSTTASGLLIRTLINQEQFSALNHFLFPIQQSPIRYRDLRTWIMGSPDRPRFFSSCRKEKMYQLYLAKGKSELIDDTERSAFFR